MNYTQFTEKLKEIDTANYTRGFKFDIIEYYGKFYVSRIAIDSWDLFWSHALSWHKSRETAERTMEKYYNWQDRNLLERLFDEYGTKMYFQQLREKRKKQ